jgi:hypothetical protein
MSTPVICANAIFFIPVDAYESAVKLRVKSRSGSHVRIFHNGFHRKEKTREVTEWFPEPNESLDGAARGASLCVLEG